MTEENGTTPEQPVQGQILIQMTPQGMAIQITPQPFTLVIDEASMGQMINQWFTAHPELVEPFVKAQLHKKQTELTIIRDIRASKLN